MVFKIAVVGLGKIATDQHLPCIAKNADFKLAAGVSRHAKVDNVPCFESLGDLISSGMAIDAWPCARRHRCALPWRGRRLMRAIMC